ncbi:MAG: DNA polymerase domain-containing protein [archaeon]
MKAWLMDAYRKGNSVVLWLKVPQDILIEKRFSSVIYIDRSAERFLEKERIPHYEYTGKTYSGTKKVFALPVPDLSQYERFVGWIERKTRHRVPLYNADVAPEDMFLYKNNLTACGAVEIDGEKIIPAEGEIALKSLRTTVIAGCRRDSEVKSIIVNEKRLSGREHEILKRFADIFIKEDPDVVQMDYAFSRLPYLEGRMQKYGIDCPFHRFDPGPITYRGGRSFFSYGRVFYRDYAIRLHGRFLVDTSSPVGSECGIDAIIELAQLSGAGFQKVASRSFGAVFQTALIRLMVQQGYLIHYKEKPVERPLSMFELLKSDRAGHTFDPKVGFHRNVAEIDFCSMYPWIIFNRNISAETLMDNIGPFEHAPGIPVRISLRKKGLVPAAIKPILDRRMYYKRNPTAVNKAKSVGLKWVLVTSYGYLRFREFKLGMASSHMAICAYARETILQAARLAEEKGYYIVHGIVDSLYIKRIKEDAAKDFCSELESLTGIPVSFDGMFRWIVFLPSVNDIDRPVPARYFGVFYDGTIKARGIEVRQRGTPTMVKKFQQKVLETISRCKTKKEIIAMVPELCRMLRKAISWIPKTPASELAASVCISKSSYKHNIPQKTAVEKLKKRGITPMPGQVVHFIFQKDKIVLPDEYNEKPNIAYYRKLLVRSLFVVLQPFGFSKNRLAELSGVERQAKLSEYTTVRHIYIPICRKYKSRAGLSEKLIRQRLERQGWTVWRGGSLWILKQDEVYPNVRRKYEKLIQLMAKHKLDHEYLQYLCHVHHGMPDYLCYRNRRFKFVECKLGHEQLGKGQKKCISKLQGMGFTVEVHKLVDPCTKTRAAEIDIANGTKSFVERQLAIKRNY